MSDTDGEMATNPVLRGAAADDVGGFFTPVPIPRLPRTMLSSDDGVSGRAAQQLTLPGTLLAGGTSIGPTR